MSVNLSPNIPEIPVEDARTSPAPQKEEGDRSISPEAEDVQRSSMSIVLPELRPKNLKAPQAPKKSDGHIAIRRASLKKNSSRSSVDRSSQVSFVDASEPVEPIKNPIAPPEKSVEQASMESLHSSQLVNNTKAVKEEKEPIDNKRRFVALFWGLLTVFVGSSYGTYAIFSLYLKLLYNFSFADEINVFVAGTAGGLAFGVLAGIGCDYFGHRLTMGFCMLLCFVSTLFMGLTFDGNFQISTPNMSAFFFLMNAGGYGLQLVAIVVTVSHFPRNRGMVCGLYQALGGFAASFYGTQFRGFFDSSLPNIFYLCTAIVGFFGIICIMFYAPAPYVDFRFYRAIRMVRAERGLLLPADFARSVQKKMGLYFRLKVPFMKYGLPRRRVRIVFMCLLVLNVFMTTQVLLIAYQNITSRSILCAFSAIALVLLLLLTIIVWPFKWLDEKMDYSKDSIDMDECATQLTSEQDIEAFSPRVSVLELFRVTRGVLGQDLSASTAPAGAPFPENTSQNNVDQRRSIDDIVNEEIKHLTLQNRMAINYDSVTELLKCRNGWVQAIFTFEFWMLIWLSLVLLGTGIVMTNNMFMQIYYTGINGGSMKTTTYYLYSAVSGILIGGGRMATGVIADDIMPALRIFLKIPFHLPSTFLLCIPSWLCVFGLFLHLAVPNTSGLLAGYVFLSIGFGVVTAAIPYAVTCFFSYEHVGLGKMYGMCLLAAGVGVVVFYRGIFYEEYYKNAYPMDFPLPEARGVCLSGKRDCAQTFLIITFILNVSAAVVATILHFMYQKKVSALAKHLIEALNLVRGIPEAAQV